MSAIASVNGDRSEEREHHAAASGGQWRGETIYRRDAEEKLTKIFEKSKGGRDYDATINQTC